jgi:tRNA pseudouridine32 synthase/23S rRNA pseudouridine746 synthase/23S rRNA pseudouridine955/2504/2580 synthase
VHLVVLQQKDGLVAVAKPPGLLVIPGRTPDDQVCARDLLSRQLGQRVWVCHRIDRDTSGVVLFATDEQAHRAASMAFEHGLAKKKYLALVEGTVKDPLDLTFPLVEGRKGKIRLALEGEPAKEARTLVRPLEFLQGATLVECEPLTGRQHQIRVHLKASGHPLLFDHQYGRREPLQLGDFTLSRTPLHAASLVIESLGIDVTAPLPADLAEAVRRLRIDI